MKGLKKLALVSAIVAAPFAAQAELKAMDDAMMGDVTGQAGVTIELQTQVAIGEFRYTDTDGGAANEIGGGTFAVTGITLGGAGAALGGTALLDDLYIDIDLANDGDAVISVHSISGKPIDWGFAFASASLRGAGAADPNTSTTLFTNFNAIGLLAKLDITVDTATDDLIVDVGFSVENMQMDIPFLAVGIRGLSVHGVNFSGLQSATAPTGPLANFAFVTVRMGTDTTSRVGGGATDVLRIDIPSFAADVNIAQVLVGGTNIGQVTFDNLAITNTTMKVYGH